MPNRAFNSAVSFWRMAADNEGVIRSIRQEGEWSLGNAIDVVIHEPADEQWRFSAITGNEAIDHLDMRRLAATSLYEAWALAKARAPRFMWGETGWYG